MLLISSSKGLVRVSLPTQNPKTILDDYMIQADGILTHRENSVIQKTKKQLTQYFNHKRKYFFLPLDVQGTDFQKHVWNALCAIEFGTTQSYQDVAKAIDCPKGYRAVGMANHVNPVPIIIPCHRVITSSGALGGYADNTTACLSLKQALLDLETQTNEHENNGMLIQSTKTAGRSFVALTN